MNANHFKLNVLVLFIGILLGMLITRYSGKTLVGQPVPEPPARGNDGSEYSHRQQVSPLDLSKLYPDEIFRRGNPRLAELALTFDDGPDQRYTPQILDILKKNQIKATFFVVGTQIQKYPQIFKRIIREGHEIGSHSYQHLKFSELSAAKIESQLRKNQETIHANGGPPETAIFRPPYGALDPHAIEAIRSQHYRIILWTIDSLDWRALNKIQVERNVLPAVQNGDIILQHCAAFGKKENLTGSVASLPDLIQANQKKGFKFVTVSKLLRDQAIIEHKR